MSFHPTPRQALAIWRMLFLGETPMAGVVAERLGKRGRVERDQLVKEGIIELTRLPRPRRGSRAEITEKGWAWAQQNLDAEVSRSNLAAEALEALLKHLKRFLEMRELALSEIIQPSQAPPVKADLEGQIRETYSKLSGGRSSVRVRLSDLRQAMSEVPWPDLEAALLSMQHTGTLSLYGLDDPQDIRPEDKESAIAIAGFKKHVIYLRG